VSIAAAAVLLGPGASAPSAGPDFNQEIRPILSRNCFKCHGPDDEARKAGMRLDRRETAIKETDSGSVPIVPGRPDESELIARINSSDESVRMPPRSTNLELTAKQKDLLRGWIAAGAEYRPHWSFVPPKSPPLPTVKQTPWPRNPIDRFVLAKLEAQGLAPSPPADRYTLLRRVALDLTGVQPTPAEVDAVLAEATGGAAVEQGDPGGAWDRAYRHYVDRLIASPQYGERWARRWLDLARYSDTNGYEKDKPRTIWPYRDWVIRALNDDMPFDQFTIEQIAGDMLPGATQAQRVATGFHRNTMLNEEGGIDPLEYRFYAMTDRVGTTATTWLGLTMMCAQCHTHKFDPIAHREYYQFMALMNNADEPAMDLPTAEIAAQRAARQKRIELLTAELPAKYPLADVGGKPGAAASPRASAAKIVTPTRSASEGSSLALRVGIEQLSGRDHKPAGAAAPSEARRRQALARGFSKWIDNARRRAVRWTVLRPVEARANVPLLTVEPDDSVIASGDASKNDKYQLKFRSGLRGVTAFRLEVLPDDRLPGHGPGRVYYEGSPGNFLLTDLSLRRGGHKLAMARAVDSFHSGDFTAAKAIDADLQSPWEIDGGQGQRHVAVFVLQKPLADFGEIDLEMCFEAYYACGLGRFRIAVTTAADPEAQERPEDIERLLSVAEGSLTAADRQRLQTQFLLEAPEMAEARRELDKLIRSEPQYPTTLVMQERPPQNARPTFVHHRGEFLQPQQRVEPGVPAFLPGLPPAAPRNRLALARWLVARDNPLVARVTVNRQWAALFGTGIVRTTGDFGSQGEPPTHPELLDWLAVRFMDDGWSMKKLHRLIVTSATYRQSSRITPQLLQKDPENRLFARGPRFRLEAELIRDDVLRASGLLSNKMYGPSVFPPQLPTITTEGAYGPMTWTVSQGEDRYRRSLYTFNKRTAPFASYITFDAPSGEVCCARRDVSNTPLQALTLLNSELFLEPARAAGRQMAADSRPVPARLADLFRHAVVRPPTPQEIAALMKFYQQQLARIKAGKLDAKPLAGDGPGDLAARAAWTLTARAVYNLDEMITKE
jgi:hypothetical protein